MPSGRRGRGVPYGDGGFALPLLLVALAVAAVAATRAEISTSYRLARDREDELHFRAQAYVAAIRAFYLAEAQVTRRRLPTSLDELERDPRFPLKRHIRRLYDDPLARKAGTPFRTLTGSPAAGLPQGIIGVASTSSTPLLRRAGFTSNAGPTLGLSKASDLAFEVDLQELATASRPAVVPPSLPPFRRPKAN